MSILKTLTESLYRWIGDRGVEGKITTIKYARENKVPFFGICLGMQLAV